MKKPFSRLPRMIEYAALDAAWEAICALPIDDTDKSAACRVILLGYIDQLALAAFRTSSPAIRFYLEMMQLRNLLVLVGDTGNSPAAFDLARRPSYRHVDDWLQANRQEYGKLTPRKRLPCDGRGSLPPAMD